LEFKDGRLISEDIPNGLQTADVIVQYFKFFTPDDDGNDSDDYFFDYPHFPDYDEDGYDDWF